MRSSTAWWVVSAALLIAGCGGSSSNNNNNPPAPVAPTVTAVTPASASTGMAVNSIVTATFSTGMSASTITSSTFTLAAEGGSALTGTVSYNSGNDTATFTPGAPLANNTAYTATITSGAAASTGTALVSNFSWSFTTAAAPAPTVTAVTPANASTGVAVNSIVTATFSAGMSASTITSSTFTLAAQGGSALTGTVSYNSGNDTATFTPGAPLTNNTTYTATVTTGAAASTGTALASNYTWSFATASGPAPMIVAATPANLATDIAITTPVTATFSSTMIALTIAASTFTLAAQGGAVVQGIVSYNSATSVATFNPAANLAHNTTYIATITTGAMSSAGAALASNYEWTFTTAAAPAPTVVSTVPAPSAVNVNVSDALTATFSQPMTPSTITASTFTLTGPGNAGVTGIIAYNAGTSTATFTPSSALAYSASYTATITIGATSAAGAELGSNYVWNFTTGANPNQGTVNFGTTYQTIRGFGGSTAWLGQMPPAVVTGLFDPVNGLGLNILRLRIDPEGSSSSANPYETGEWDYEAKNGLLAVTANPKTIVFASPWTPPANWKLNGSSSFQDDGKTWNQSFANCAEGNGYCGGYLDPNHYEDFANFLEGFVAFFNKTNGFNLYAISMQNEPEENVTYESCVWTPEQMDTWIANNASTITSDPYSTKLIMPESDTFNPVDAAKALGDPNAEGQISIVGGHIYQTLSGGTIAPYPALPAGDTPKELWMTEFGPLTTYPGTAPTWVQALPFAETVHNSMVTGQYNAYVWWGIFGTPTNAGTYGLVDNSGNPTVFGYALGQYSKFIQPGYVRVAASASPVSGVYVSAYKGNGHYVIVAINSNSASRNLSLALSGGTVTSLTPYQTTSAAGLASQAAVSVSSGEFNYTLPAQSIVTFVQ